MNLIMLSYKFRFTRLNFIDMREKTMKFSLHSVQLLLEFINLGLSCTSLSVFICKDNIFFVRLNKILHQSGNDEVK